ncbi:sulfurtransferase TusA family protein [Streptomyces sp. NPDC006314]|uniref:sulfurtransferase TusA family protein n=1 Tax=Streptomyces sp. NPDC006314 TaxID=3154475 RepID=UPI0033AB8B87
MNPKTPKNPEAPAPGITVDGTGLLCGTLLLRPCKEIDGGKPGILAHVIANDPDRTTRSARPVPHAGHDYLGPSPAQQGVYSFRYSLRLAAQPTQTRPDAPWHRATPAADVESTGG